MVKSSDLKTPRKHLNWVDIAKGIAIILLVMKSEINQSMH